MADPKTENWKYRKNDLVFIEKREEFFKTHKNLDPKLVIDHWPLFIGAVPLAELMARYELLKMTLNVPGHILEFGSFQGAHLCFIAKILQTFAPNDYRTIYGFDSFEGLNQFSPHDKTSPKELGQYKGSREFLEEMMALHSLEDRIKLVVGYIETTLPKFIEEHPHHIYSYIYFDTDLYKATRVGLDLLWPRLAQGGIIAFDEGYHDRFPGEGTALQEFLRTIPGQYECGQFPFARQPMLWIRKK